ncbi:hypothetical protein RJT34_14668 [Clitoria ternatea]|uniref:Uncharacterized protein n=1 Tax=Clitoria ternatea TaxID=43366 RepID=A0AAN9PMV5_CLITE
MAQDLVKIGLEGFALIDTFYGGRQRQQGRWGFQGTTQDHCCKEEAVVINSKDAASKYGGIMVVNYSKTKPQNRWGKFMQVFKP